MYGFKLNKYFCLYGLSLCFIVNLEWIYFYNSCILKGRGLVNSSGTPIKSFSLSAGFYMLLAYLIMPADTIIIRWVEGRCVFPKLLLGCAVHLWKGTSLFSLKFAPSKIGIHPVTHLLFAKDREVGIISVWILFPHALYLYIYHIYLLFISLNIFNHFGKDTCAIF